MNLLDAAFNVVHDYKGGACSLAPRIGKNATTLAHELKGTGTAKLGLMDAQKITHATEDLRILQAWAEDAGQMLVPLPDVALVADDECMLALAKTAAAFGETVREVSMGLGDGKITDNELADIELRCGVLIANLHSLRTLLAQRNALLHARAPA